LKTIFVSGTAGSGKSLLTSKLNEYYATNGAFAAILNLDPGVDTIPYTCDVDVRDYVDYVSIMQQYELGPNGAMVMANDLIASKIDDIQNDINKVNPDYLIVDTPGQIELFAYRSSGRFLVENISSEEKTNILSMIKLLKKTAVWVFAICAFLYVMIEQSLNTWLPTFNKEIFNLSEARTAGLLAIYPASIAASRLLAGYYSKHISWIKSQLILLSGAFIVILTVLIITSDYHLTQNITHDNTPLLAIIILLTGFFIGPIYPTIVSIILSKTEKVQQSAMTGLIVVFSALGGTSGSLIIGLLSQNYSVHSAFYFPLIPITLLGLLLFPYKKITDK